MKDAIDLVFTILLIFMVTCVGSMLMICAVFEMEKKTLPPQTETQRSSADNYFR